MVRTATAFNHPGMLLGLQIGSNITPFAVPPINTVNSYILFPDAPMGPTVFGIVEPACCTQV
jgi:hypothetical protein